MGREGRGRPPIRWVRARGVFCSLSLSLSLSSRPRPHVPRPCCAPPLLSNRTSLMKVLVFSAWEEAAREEPARSRSGAAAAGRPVSRERAVRRAAPRRRRAADIGGWGSRGGGGEGWLPGLLVLLSVCACACVWRRPEGRARRVGVDKWGGRGAASFFFFFRLSLARIAFTRRDCPPWPMHAPRPAAGATAATPPPPTLAPPPPIRIRQARWTDAAAIGRLTAEVRRRREREQKKHALSLAQPPAPGACLSVQGRGRKGERVARAARARTRPRPTRTPTGGCAPHSGVGCHPPFS